ncbi:MAG: AbrB/MazE/SpoVT family DNA-binding domain-containing protein [Candidatus Scalindua sp. AMX11]|nr:MAG: AbrB/MazE/SpoVT family DNA-binding domain-containing protein [Candidatus Scalindua sp.]NOG83584.1 AbrB/MazE/SpoVT family DNA-binding domain-containing protein [Planctomycetota bacterium]RZV70914.1 MAG: AbrB/MazE/SpoVT family DNA-binding domain-containing protein [Candidatus Scalindua sp. SCAELEC01]TDE64221.1 MAG: AbrB/MazE/SpoVT family DNA-binding domain-containing protein [Candidatus Scalindua sp. AMX11]
MLRKICAIGNSYGISIPKEILEKLQLSAGAQVDVKLDETTRNIIIEPASHELPYKTIDSFCTEISHRRPSLDQRFRILAFQMKRNLKKTLKQDSLHEFRHTDTVVSYFIVNV